MNAKGVAVLLLALYGCVPEDKGRGNIAPLGSTTVATRPALAVGPDRRVAVAWGEANDRGQVLTRLAHWDGSEWQVEPLLGAPSTGDPAPKLRFTPDGKLLLLTTEGFSSSRLVLRERGAAGAWRSLALDDGDGQPYVLGGRLEVRADGAPLILSDRAWSTDLLRFDGSTLVEATPSVTRWPELGMHEGLALDAQDRPVVYWTVDEGTDVARWTGESWVRFPRVPVRLYGRDDFLLDGDGAPLLLAQGPGGCRILRGTMEGWTEKTPPVATDVEAMRLCDVLSRDGDGHLVTAWTELPANTRSRLSVSRWIDGTGWAPIVEALADDPWRGAWNPAVGFFPGEPEPVLVWTEPSRGGAGSEIFVRVPPP